MDDGTWIMAGLKVGEGNPAIVAISHSDDLTKWDVVPIRPSAGMKMWGESTVIVNGQQVTSLSRYTIAMRRVVGFVTSNTNLNCQKPLGRR